MKTITCILGSLALVLAGCNTPTPSARLPTPQISTSSYEHLDCARLAVEHDRLTSTELEFTRAQENRISASRGHALFYGWGSGDGMETVELTKIRGERNAVHRTQLKKGCTGK